jgi:ribosome-binding factor A
MSTHGITVVMKDTNRPRRVAQLIKRELATLIARELHDPRAHSVTLTDTEVSRDLSSARIYFTLLGDAREIKQATVALNHAAGFLRYALKQRLSLRGVPELRFYYDDTIEKGSRISYLIERALTDDKGQKTD